MIIHSAESFLALYDGYKHLISKEKLSCECSEAAAAFARAGEYQPGQAKTRKNA